MPPKPTMAEHPLNRIFYGPPGTGKTYHTVNAALAILDPNFDESKKRSELMNRFEELKNEGRIGFVTFHQNFGYEEFVEGLKATTDDGKISYDVKYGVFKRLCEQAEQANAASGIEHLKEECSKGPIEMKSIPGGEKFKIHYPGKSGEEYFDVERLTSAGETLMYESGYASGTPRKLYPLHIENEIKIFLLGKLLPERDYIRSVIRYIKAIADYINKDYVLIIDEINRGNISRIFGELITLIEPSKRAGAEDALSVTLPYSGESFSVPKNLYIIGTMNTADRSIALLDTALRRRFRFEEMMPDLKLLDGVSVEGVEIQRLLSAMNERIKALYDRDHQIGHAYFLPLKEDPSLARLSDIFRHSVLPLLQEYFYEDWEKIDMVLGKNGFLSYSEPPSGLGLDNEKRLWRIDENAFNNVENYRKIYGG